MKKLITCILDLFRSKRDPKTIGKQLIKIVALDTGILCEHWQMKGDPGSPIYVRVINYKLNGYKS